MQRRRLMLRVMDGGVMELQSGLIRVRLRVRVRVRDGVRAPLARAVPQLWDLHHGGSIVPRLHALARETPRLLHAHFGLRETVVRRQHLRLHDPRRSSSSARALALALR